MGDICRVIDDYGELACKELQKIVDSNELTPTQMEIVSILSDSLKDFEKYKMLKFASRYGSYYQDGDYYDNYNRYPDYMYRDSDGSHHTPGENYNRYNGSHNHGDRYYNNYGHSPSEMKEQTIHELERIMNEMPEGQAKDQIRQRVQRMRSEMN